MGMTCKVGMGMTTLLNGYVYNAKMLTYKVRKTEIAKECIECESAAASSDGHLITLIIMHVLQRPLAGHR